MFLSHRKRQAIPTPSRAATFGPSYEGQPFHVALPKYEKELKHDNMIWKQILFYAALTFVYCVVTTELLIQLNRDDGTQNAWTFGQVSLCVLFCPVISRRFAF
jgi:hypothetical protein